MNARPNLQCRLRRRPAGVAQADDFDLSIGAVRTPEEGEVQIRNQFLSVEPAMRGWIADADNYASQIGIGDVMRALAAGEVVASRHSEYREGDLVAGWFGWQEYATVAVDKIVRRVLETDLPLSLSLGVLGINGATALLALTKIGQPKQGETIVVSTASGAVGSAVGQIARLLGCRAVGVAGGPVKTGLCLSTFGYDAAVDYRAPGWEAALAASCPDGVDIYFDNVSGPTSDVVHQQLAHGARIVVCGTAAFTDWSRWPQGPRIERRLLTRRARMEGFVIFDHMGDYEAAIERLAGWVRSGVLRYREDVLEGMQACPDALAGLYRGENLGKRVIRLY